tara:strand:- start:63200 stop:64759 length:1560 start_codon:yes stop_codon:yes gene_type:complete
MLSVRSLWSSAFTPVICAGLMVCSSGVAAFDFNTVIDKAQSLSKKDYEAPEQAPQFLRDLSYSQYHDVRFKPERSLWRGSKSSFQVKMMPPGMYYSHAVTINEVDSEGVRPVVFDKSVFNYPSPAFEKRIPADLGYAGFKLTFPMKSGKSRDEFLMFAGASYFQGIGRDNEFGVSARGIALNTGLPSGEEVPAFTEFWLEHPAGDSKSMTVYGLLDGPSVTGAYQFQIHPGDSTRIDVTAKLFFRSDIDLLGMAPLTSMFYYGENTVKPKGEWRPQVHDSDGLLVHDGKSGEWLWRPLINPRDLRMSYLQTEDVRGFGFMQRDTDFGKFEDLEARYDKRPSAWVEAKGDWGKGQVVLVEIPTRSEVNDNIVAFWRPEGPIKAGAQMGLDYSLTFGDETVAGQETAHAVRTFVGDGDRVGGGDVDGAYRLIVDFTGGELDDLTEKNAVVSKVTGGKGVEVLEHFVVRNPEENTWRLSMLVKPASNQVMSLRAFLSLDNKPLTETWSYELPPGSDIRADSE